MHDGKPESEPSLLTGACFVGAVERRPDVLKILLGDRSTGVENTHAIAAIDDLCADFVDEAILAGGRDNITVICIKV